MKTINFLLVTLLFVCSHQVMSQVTYHTNDSLVQYDMIDHNLYLPSSVQPNLEDGIHLFYYDKDTSILWYTLCIKSELIDGSYVEYSSNMELLYHYIFEHGVIIWMYDRLENKIYRK